MSFNNQHLNILRIIGIIAVGLNPATRQSFRELAKEIKELDPFSLSSEKLADYPLLAKIAQDYTEIEVTAEKLVKWSQGGIEVVALGEKHYPRRLAQIFEPPLILYHKGELTARITEKPTLAIVGAREGDLESCQTARIMARDLARQGVCIVSGLALGIDSASHLGALESETRESTIAVLANGLNTVYPPSNYSLANNILQQEGVLISQYQVDQRPFASNFLERNRTIAGLADAY